MSSLKATLKNRLKNAKQPAVLGVGSELRSDDAAGVLVAGECAKFCKSFLGSTSPENLSGQIKKFSPDHLLIVDAVQMNKPAGEMIIFSPEDEASFPSFSTHRMPLKLLCAYLKEELGCEITLLGIQPKSLEFSQEVSVEVKTAVNSLVTAIKSAIG